MFEVACPSGREKRPLSEVIWMVYDGAPCVSTSAFNAMGILRVQSDMEKWVQQLTAITKVRELGSRR